MGKQVKFYSTVRLCRAEMSRDRATQRWLLQTRALLSWTDNERRLWRQMIAIRADSKASTLGGLSSLPCYFPLTRLPPKEAILWGYSQKPRRLPSESQLIWLFFGELSEGTAISPFFPLSVFDPLSRQLFKMLEICGWWSHKIECPTKDFIDKQ